MHQANYIQFREQNGLLVARRHNKLEKYYRKLAEDVQKEIDELEKMKKRE